MIFRFFLLLLLFNGMGYIVFFTALLFHVTCTSVALGWHGEVGWKKTCCFFFGRMSELCPTLHLVGKARKIPYGMGVFRSLSRLSVRDFDMIQ